MKLRKLKRNECEEQILELLEEIKQVYRRYNPDGEYLTMVISGTHISANNAYWEKDSKRPLEFYVNDGKKGSVIP